MLSLLTTAFLLLPATPQEPAPCCQEPVQVVQNSVSQEPECSKTAKSAEECPHPAPASTSVGCTTSQMDAALASLNQKLDSCHEASPAASEACSTEASFVETEEGCDQEPAQTAVVAVRQNWVILSDQTEGLEACDDQESCCDSPKAKAANKLASVTDCQLSKVTEECSDTPANKLALVSASNCQLGKVTQECADAPANKLALVSASNCQLGKVTQEFADAPANKLASVTDCQLSKVSSECPEKQLETLAQLGYLDNVEVNEAVEIEADCCSSESEEACEEVEVNVVSIDAEIDTLLQQLETNSSGVAEEVLVFQNHAQTAQVERRIARMEKRLERIERMLAELSEKL
jgi:hypothetical protein